MLSETIFQYLYPILHVASYSVATFESIVLQPSDVDYGDSSPLRDVFFVGNWTIKYGYFLCLLQRRQHRKNDAMTLPVR